MNEVVEARLLLLRETAGLREILDHEFVEGHRPGGGELLSGFRGFVDCCVGGVFGFAFCEVSFLFDAVSKRGALVHSELGLVLQPTTRSVRSCPTAAAAHTDRQTD